MVETKTDESHILNDKSFDIDICYKCEEVITIDNDIKKGKLRILKIDKDTKEPIDGVKFEILDSATREVVEELVTNNYGIAESSELRIDKEYILKESWNNNKYLIDSQEYIFSVDDENIVELELENEKIKGSIKIKKVDEENKEIPLNKVKFELYDSNMNLLEELETDENGEVYSKEYPSVNEIYYLKEVKTNREYELTDELIEVKLIDKSILEILVTNKKIPEEIELLRLPKTGK